MHEQRDGRAERVPALGAGQNGDAVLFVARRRQLGLARAAPRELRLDVGLGEVHAGWAAVDHAADGGAVRFAEGGHAEQAAEGGHGT